MPSKGVNSLTIAEAKSYFEKHIEFNNLLKGKTMSAGSAGGHASEILFEKKQAIWKNAYQKMVSTGSAVKIPIDFDGTDLIVNKRTKATIPMSALNYLFMYKDSLLQIQAEWVYLHPDSAWLYGDRAQYTGKIIIKDWDGNIKKGFVYERDKQPYPWSQKTLKLQKTSSLSPGGKVATTYGDPNSPDCVDMSFYQADNCPCVGHTWSQRADCGCYIKPVNGVELVEIIICPPLDDTLNPSGGTSGNGQTPNGNGSTTGGTSPNPNDYPPTPCTNGQQFQNPDGTMSPMPCIPEPGFPTQNPTNVPLTPTQFVIQKLGIIDLDKVTFISDPSSGLNNAFAQYLIREKSSLYSIEFGQWLFEYLYANPTINYHDFLDPNGFSGLNNALLNDTSTPDLAIDMSGIVDIPDNTSFGPSRPLASSANRNNTEDLEFGTNGNISGILPLQLNKSDNLLFSDMTDLFELTSIGDLQTVAYQFIDRFKNGTGGTYENQTLNSEVKESGTYKNFIKKFRLDLQAKINNAGGILDNVKMELDYRPVFDGKKNRAIGFQILLNDTEETKINLLNFQINSTTQDWIADVEVIIFDHFGLDKHDALTYQGGHRGFAGWWILQHKRNYKPFITKIVIKTRLYGGL